MTWNNQNRAEKGAKITLLALYEKTIYQNEKNGFCIFRMTSEDTGIPKELGYGRDHKIHFSVIGYYLPAIRNSMLALTGAWEHSRYGLQFHVDSYTEVLPKTKSGIAAYLSSGLIKGIGKATADLIVARFGTDTLDVIEKDPKRLLEIKRISEKRLEQILDSYAGSKSMQEIMTFLGAYGVTLNKAKKIQEHFGSRSVDVIQHSPYLLCEISGFGFKTVDQIARNINFLPADPLRLENGILFILEEAKDGGDLFLMQDILLERAYVLLSEAVPKGEVTEAMIKNTFSDLCAYGKLHADGERIYLPQFFHFEEQTAKITAKLLSAKKRHSTKLEQYLQEVQKENGVLLSEKQAEAVQMCMENRFSIITGGPGTGKTTVLKSILAVYQRLHPGKEILLAAPTGRAARKMAESTGFPYASTLHAALNLTSDTADYEEVIIPADFVVVDEASMVDMRLAYYLLHSLGTGTKMLFVGDANQLPSVGVMIDNTRFARVMESFDMDEITLRDLELRESGDYERVICLCQDELLTEEKIIPFQQHPNTAPGVDTEQQIVKLAVFERHHHSGHVGIGFLGNFSLKCGAVASSIAHDSHNLIVAGDNDADMVLAGNTVRKNKGGLAFVANGKVMAEVALPVAGLMSTESAESVAEKMQALEDALKAHGVAEDSGIFMTLAFVSLPVIPKLRLNTYGIVDVAQQKIVPAVF